MNDSELDKLRRSIFLVVFICLAVWVGAKYGRAIMPQANDGNIIEIAMTGSISLVVLWVLLFGLIMMSRRKKKDSGPYARAKKGWQENAMKEYKGIYAGNAEVMYIGMEFTMSAVDKDPTRAVMFASAQGAAAYYSQIKGSPQIQSFVSGTENDNIANASRSLALMAANNLKYMKNASEFTPVNKAYVRFFVVTRYEKFMADARENELKHKTHPLQDLFFAAHEVISGLRHLYKEVE